jgi:hypothetical protein
MLMMTMMTMRRRMTVRGGRGSGVCGMTMMTTRVRVGVLSRTGRGGGGRGEGGTVSAF